MNGESPENVSQECGGDAQQNGGSTATDTATPRPAVQAEIVRLPRARRESAQPSPRDNGEAARQVRAERRRQLLAIFFTGHTPGRLNVKREAAYALINRVADPVEREQLQRLLQNVWDAAQSTS